MIRFTNIVRRYIERQKLKLDDVHAGILLNRTLSQGKYFPTTGSSLNLHSVATVVNDVIVNRRQCVIEFGAGLSTLCFARLVRDFDLNTKIVSVDDNEAWLQIMKERLVDEGLQDRVNLVFAPLASCEHAKNSLLWYDQAAINSATESLQSFDVVLVDGPMAYDRPRALSRYPAVPFLAPRLSPGYAIFLDDMHRDGEKEIAKSWQSELGAKRTVVNSNFVMLSKGNFFNPVV